MTTSGLNSKSLPKPKLDTNLKDEKKVSGARLRSGYEKTVNKKVVEHKVPEVPIITQVPKYSKSARGLASGP